MCIFVCVWVCFVCVWFCYLVVCDSGGLGSCLPSMETSPGPGSSYTICVLKRWNEHCRGDSILGQHKSLRIRPLTTSLQKRVFNRRRLVFVSLLKGIYFCVCFSAIVVFVRLLLLCSFVCYCCVVRLLFCVCSSVIVVFVRLLLLCLSVYYCCVCRSAFFVCSFVIVVFVGLHFCACSSVIVVFVRIKSWYIRIYMHIKNGRLRICVRIIRICKTCAENLYIYWHGYKQGTKSMLIK